jgi:DNA-binding PadR family transcriptional regulator
MKLLVDQIADKLEEMHGKKPDKGMIQKFLDELRKTSFSDAKTAEEKKKMIQKMTESFYNLGYIGFYATS